MIINLYINMYLFFVFFFTGLDEDYLREHEEATRLKTVVRISIGPHLVDCWYFSPYPAEVQDVPVLFICEFCLSFFV